MNQARMLAASVLPTDDSGARGWLVGLVLLALAIGVGWWFVRISRSPVSSEMVERTKRSRKDRALTEPDDVAATLAAAAALDDGFGSIPDVHAGALPQGDQDGRTVQDRLAELDNALTTGAITAEAHRVLRAALLEGLPGGWTRPTPPPE